MNRKSLQTLFLAASVISHCIYEYKKRKSSKNFIWRLNMDMSSFSLVITSFNPSQSYTSVTHEKHPLERSDFLRSKSSCGGGGGSQGKWCFQAPEIQFFQNGLQSGFFFFETSAYRFPVDGRKRRLSKTIIPCMSYSER